MGNHQQRLSAPEKKSKKIEVTKTRPRSLKLVNELKFDFIEENETNNNNKQDNDENYDEDFSEFFDRTQEMSDYAEVLLSLILDKYDELWPSSIPELEIDPFSNKVTIKDLKSLRKNDLEYLAEIYNSSSEITEVKLLHI